MARQITVEIIGEADKFRKTLDGAADDASGFGSKLATAAKIGVAATAAIGVATVAAGMKVFEMGSQFEAMDAKAATVFGSSLSTVESWAKGTAQAMGLTERTAIGLAASMGDLLVPMGFTRDEAAKMSTDIVGLSGALSEWSGGTKSAAEVSEVLQKALLGERDGLKALGISITEADISARLATKGQEGLTGAALEQAKAMATQELIFEKTTDAQTAYADGTAKGLRIQAEMGAIIGELGELLVTTFYPIVLKVAQVLRDVLPKAIQMAKDAWAVLGPIVGTVANVLGRVASVVLPILGAAFGIVGKVLGVIGGAFGAVANVVGRVSGAFGKVAGVVLPAVGAAFRVVGGVIDVIRKGMGFLGDGARLLGSLFGGLARNVANAWNSILGAIKRVINTIIRGWNSIKFTLPSVDLGPLGKFGGFTIGTPNIPYLHSGGVVPGPKGADVLTVLQAGEGVTSVRDMNGGGRAIHIHIGTFVGTGPAIDNLASQIAFRVRTVGA